LVTPQPSSQPEPKKKSKKSSAAAEPTAAPERRKQHLVTKVFQQLHARPRGHVVSRETGEELDSGSESLSEGEDGSADGTAGEEAGAPAPGADLEFSSSEDERLPEDFVSKKKKHKKRLDLSDSDEAAGEQELQQRAARYQRGQAATDYREIRNPKLRSRMKANERTMRETARAIALTEALMPVAPGLLEVEGELERTDRVKQEEIATAVDVQSSRKAFELTLTEMGPYVGCAYSRNGRSLLLAGAKGHVALMGWAQGHITTEFQVRETIRDVTFLHDESLFAVAQRKYVYIYDRRGVELHCLRKHINVNRLEFLPYHFLLVSVGLPGYLKYQDVSTGAIVAEHRTKLGPCQAMAQNPWNAIIHLGHNDGTVTLWSPNITKYQVKIQCHRGSVLDVAVDPRGNQMVTAGLDGQLKVWDLRNSYRHLHAYFTPRPAASIDISQRGLLAVAAGPHLQVWPAEALQQKVAKPYMRSIVRGHNILKAAFCPYEDVLGLGHSNGFSSLLIPGAGEANYDTFEVNPFQTKKQRREHQVHQLLEKIQPDLITLNTNLVGQLDPRTRAEQEQDRQAQTAAAAAQLEAERRSRGKNPALRAKRRKRANIRDAKSVAIEEQQAREKEWREEQKQQAQVDAALPNSALSRFRPKRAAPPAAAASS
jgi:U3 small nucleolar RNA-associated protein 7